MNNYYTRFVGSEASEILTKIHIQCFPRYWNRQAFTDFFSVENTFAILVEDGDFPPYPSPLPQGEVEFS